MPIEVRRITEADIPGYNACCDTVARERLYLAMLEAPPLERSRVFVQGLLKSGAPMVVAADGDEIVGWCDINPLTHEVFRHRGGLGMGLWPAYRRQGLGKRLLEAALAAAREHGLERVDLQVYAKNIAAIRLYEKAGFVVEGTFRQGRKLDGVYDDVLLMVKFLQ